MQSSRKIITRVAEVSVDDNEIIYVTILDSVDVDEFDIVDLSLIIKRLSNNQPALKLFDSRNKWTISLHAKKKAMSDYSDKKTIARAVVVSNKLKSGVLSFIKNFESKKYPQKYFTNIDEAKEWLLSYKK
ncbi:MAG: hypothetical protein U0W65_11825 [Bacteroidia bacterium]